MSLRPLHNSLFPMRGMRLFMFALLPCVVALKSASAQEAALPPPPPATEAVAPAAGPAPAAPAAGPAPAAPAEAAPAPVPDDPGAPPLGEVPPAVSGEAEKQPTPPAPQSTPAPLPALTPAPTPSPIATPELSATEAAERENASLPVYMRELNLRIFDPGRGEEMTALQKAAQLMSQREHSRQQRSLAHIQNLLTYEYTLEGTSTTQIVTDAQTRALKSAAARVYFANYFLLGRDLLEPYLRQYGAPSVARTTVLERRLLAGDRQQMTVRVSVNLDELYRDLNEKHFIAKPNLRPVVAVHLQELIEGKADTSGGGRLRIEQTMDRNLFRVNSRKMAKPPLNANLTADAELLQAARFEAQRNDVDVLVTGVLTIRSSDRGQVLFDQYAFQDADLSLKMYRVDTGELLMEVVDRYSASGTTPEQATSNVLDALMARSTQKLADYLRSHWGRQMLEDDSTRIMISGVAADEVPATMNVLRSFAPGVEVYKKAYYGDVLVLNVVLPDKVHDDDFAGFLRGWREPQFDVDQVSKRKFILEVI